MTGFLMDMQTAELRKKVVCFSALTSGLLTVTSTLADVSYGKHSLLFLCIALCIVIPLPTIAIAIYVALFRY